MRHTCMFGLAVAVLLAVMMNYAETKRHKKRHFTQWSHWACRPDGMQSRSRRNNWTKIGHLQWRRSGCPVCQLNCLSCLTAGAGSCDPGQCTAGSDTNAYTGQEDCVETCCVHIKTYGPRAGTGTVAYMTITDSLGRTRFSWPGQGWGSTVVSGRYVGILDLDNCTIIEPLFQDLNATDTITLMLNWWSQNPSNADGVVIEFYVGGDLCTAAGPGCAPHFNLYINQLTGSGAYATLYSNLVQEYRSCITGVQYANFTISNVVTV